MFTRWLFVAVLALWPVATHGQIISTVRVGTWQIEEYTQACFARSPSLALTEMGYGRTMLVFALTPKALDLLLMNRNWRMEEGKRSSADVFVNERSVGRLQGEVFNKDALTLRYPVDFLERLAGATTIRIKFNLREYEFRLEGARGGLSGLAECLKRKMESVTAGAGAASTAPSAGGLAFGSGFFVSHDGTMLTNNHVIANCSSVTVAGYGTAQIVRRDPQNDMALIRVQSKPNAVAVFASTPVEHAEKILAFGYPFSTGLRGSLNVTSGIVSSMTGQGGDVRYFQISAAIQPGNSGGPVLNGAGQVVGVVTAKFDQIKVARATGVIPENIAWALRSDIAVSFLRINRVPFQAEATASEKSDREVARSAADFVQLIACVR